MCRELSLIPFAWRMSSLCVFRDCLRFLHSLPYWAFNRPFSRLLFLNFRVYWLLFLRIYYMLSFSAFEFHMRFIFYTQDYWWLLPQFLQSISFFGKMTLSPAIYAWFSLSLSAFLHSFSSISLLHIIHNHVVSASTPKYLLTPTLVDRLLCPLLVVSMQSHRVIDTNRLHAQFASLERSRLPTVDLASIADSLALPPEMTDELASVPARSNSINNWLEASEADSDHASASCFCWICSPYAVILAERILVRLITACGSSAALDFVLGRLLFTEQSVDADQFSKFINDGELNFLLSFPLDSPLNDFSVNKRSMLWEQYKMLKMS